MSCSNGPAGCASIPPVVPVGTTNALGAFGPSCCRGPCPSLELVPVEICVQVNSSTCVTFAEACLVDASTCTFTADWGITQDSWGRRCRTVHFVRQVPSNKYIQLSFCACNPCVGCTWSPSVDPARPVNVLTKIRINGVNYLDALQSIHADWANFGVCNSIVCRGAECCVTGEDTFDSLANIPGGAVITLGPVAEISLAVEV